MRWRWVQAPVIYEAGGVRQLIIWHPSALVSLDPATGEVHGEQPWDAGGMNVVTPVRAGNYLFVSNFYVGSLMMRLSTDRPRRRQPPPPARHACRSTAQTPAATRARSAPARRRRW
ncbi:MAG: hypothetical protein J4F37_12400 [Acidobacteria bacterium]|nr:hypothetical protein [Acidobacteriota bacterium]